MCKSATAACRMYVLVLSLLALSVSGEDEKVDGDATCVWPHCLPRCDARDCPESSLGTCWFSYVGMFHCHSVWANSDCFAGECLCQPGFCAQPADDGIGFTCEPLDCGTPGGPTPPPMETSTWQKQFLLFAPTNQFPKPKSLEDNPGAWVKSLITLPVLILLIGICASCCTCYCICCGGGSGFHLCKGGSSYVPLEYDPEDEDEYKKAVIIEKYTSAATDTSSSSMEVGQEVSVMKVEGMWATVFTPDGLISRVPAVILGDPKAKAKVPKKPSILCLLCLAAVILVICIYATLSRVALNTKTVTTIDNLMGSLHGDASQITSEIGDLKTTINKFQTTLDGLEDNCKSRLIRDGVLDQLTGSIGDNIGQFSGQINDIADATAPIPDEIAKAKKKIKRNEYAIVWTPTIPLIILTLLCLSILAEVLLTVCIGSSSCAKCSECMLKCSTLCFVMMILTITSVLIFVSITGVGLSQFCMDPDYNTDVYSEYYADNNVIAQSIQHYLIGRVRNPVHTMLIEAKNTVGAMDKTFADVKTVLRTVKRACRFAKGLDLDGLTEQANNVIDLAMELLGVEHIWPIYTDVVRQGICTDTLSSLGLMTMFQTLIGLIMFPICAITAHNFLVKWSIYEKYVSGEKTAE